MRKLFFLITLTGLSIAVCNAQPINRATPDSNRKAAAKADSTNNPFTALDLWQDVYDDTKEKTWWQFWSHPKFDQKKFDADKEKVLKFCRKSGYLDAEIISDSTWYSADKKKISVLLNIHEGEQYKIRNITWEGSTVYKPEALTERLQFYPGDVYNEERFEQNLRSNQDQTDVATTVGMISALDTAARHVRLGKRAGQIFTGVSAVDLGLLGEIIGQASRDFGRRFRFVAAI